MFNNLLKKVFGSRNDREVKRIMPVVERINALEPQMKAMSDEGFRELTAKFKEELAGGKTLDDLLPEAFAAVREVAWRRLKMRHFDVQMMAGVVLHQGKIGETYCVGGNEEKNNLSRRVFYLMCMLYQFEDKLKSYPQTFTELLTGNY